MEIPFVFPSFPENDRWESPRGPRPRHPEYRCGVPDFFNAKIKLDDRFWAGSVEIHTLASDWKLHHHDQDRAYDVVILHVVERADCETFRTNGEPIPQFVLEIPLSVRENIAYLLERDAPVPCLYRLSEVEPVFRTMWLDALLTERLERKTQDVLRWLELSEGDWNEAFYIALCRNFGFGINNDAFEWLAKSLPLRYILKQRGCASQVEAMFFGQAGLLEEEIPDDPYLLLATARISFPSPQARTQATRRNAFQTPSDASRCDTPCEVSPACRLLDLARWLVLCPARSADTRRNQGFLPNKSVRLLAYALLLRAKFDREGEAHGRECDTDNPNQYRRSPLLYLCSPTRYASVRRPRYAPPRDNTRRTQ